MFRFAFLIACCLSLGAHPMGNFSVNHYTRLGLSSRGVSILYVLDLAELPALELLGGSRTMQPEAAREWSGKWLSGLTISVNGVRLQPGVLRVTPQLTEGAGGLPLVRVRIEAFAASAPGELQFRDSNYPSRNGWKEIVVQAEEGGRILKSTALAQSLSRELMAYPEGAGVVPPQAVEARASWTGAAAARSLVVPKSAGLIALAFALGTVWTLATARSADHGAGWFAPVGYAALAVALWYAVVFVPWPLVICRAACVLLMLGSVVLLFQSLWCMAKPTALQQTPPPLAPPVDHSLRFLPGPVDVSGLWHSHAVLPGQTAFPWPVVVMLAGLALGRQDEALWIAVGVAAGMLVRFRRADAGHGVGALLPVFASTGALLAGFLLSLRTLGLLAR